MKPETEEAIGNIVCTDCKVEGSTACNDFCTAYQIGLSAIELFGESFLEKWDGTLPPPHKKQEELLGALQALLVLKKLAEGLLGVEK